MSACLLGGKARLALQQIKTNRFSSYRHHHKEQRQTDQEPRLRALVPLYALKMAVAIGVPGVEHHRVCVGPGGRGVSLLPPPRGRVSDVAVYAPSRGGLCKDLKRNLMQRLKRWMKICVYVFEFVWVEGHTIHV